MAGSANLSGRSLESPPASVVVLHPLLIRWPIWSATEELTYNGYIAARFAAPSRHRSIPYFLVGFWWSFQHTFLPFIPDLRFVLYRFPAFLPGVLVFLTIYLRTRRLAPLIVAHSMMDIIAAVMTLSAPAMTPRGGGLHTAVVARHMVITKGIPMHPIRQSNRADLPYFPAGIAFIMNSMISGLMA
jgi:membrane protease YdiL (CAAX protease family)